MMMYSYTKNKPLPETGLFGIRNIFRSITLELTQRCSNRCVFCAKDHKKYVDTMSLDKLDIILSHIPHFHGSVFLNMMGDALCLDNLAVYLQKIRRQWPNARIISSSSLNQVKDKSFFESIFAAGLDQIRVSCYGYTRGDYKKLHRTDRLDIVCRNISLICELDGIPRDALMPVLFADEEVRRFGIDVPLHKRRAYLLFLQSKGIQNVDLRKPHSWQGRIPEISFADNVTLRPYPCPVVWGGILTGTLNITARLDVTPCCLIGAHDGIILGNLETSSLEEIFNSQEYINFYEAHWAMRKDLYPVCRHCTFPLSVPASLPEHYRMAAWSGLRLAGKKTYFWGGGETFRAYGIFFSQTKPQAILVDTLPAAAPKLINDIPVMHPDDVLLLGDKLPLVIFANPKGNEIILKKIAQKYPRYTTNDIVLAISATEYLDTYKTINNLLE
jgi:MoaA/NifB/PqqE/SkfB family radical SAM enzyme